MFKAHPWKRILQDQDGPPAPADVETPKDGPGAKEAGDGLILRLSASSFHFNSETFRMADISPAANIKEGK